MIIKKFQGKTEEEATQLAKKELGTSVVIMNVKNVKNKGFLSFFKKPVVEVTVALEDEQDRSVYKPILPAATVRRTVETAKQEARDRKKEEVGTPADTEDTGILEKNVRSDQVETLEEKLESLHTLIEHQQLTQRLARVFHADERGLHGLCGLETVGHQHHQLAGQGDDHGIDAEAQRLEGGAQGDADAREYERGADDAQRGLAILQHDLGRTLVVSQSHFGYS